ncbi:ATP-binding protein [Paraburkholderia sp. J67]|uniref:sensor histidine kinase n=1 Tax=Paraburkholderia sp. J67 TaxID=2805435 RepID=UPI002ABD79DA|nr:ATP-binding protein [Paraburkholderia sp. J67]
MPRGRARTPLHRLCALLWASLLIALLCLAGRARAAVPPEIDLTLQNAEFAASDALTSPQTGWSPVTLPDNWTRSHPGLGGVAWYRLHFWLDRVPDVPLALYVPHVSLAGAFYLNGSLVNGDARFDRPGHMGSAMSDTPFYLELPSGLFRAGDNTLYVRLQGNARLRSGLSTIAIAPAPTLQARQRLRYLLQVTLPNAVFVILIGAFVFLAAHFWHRRSSNLMQLSGPLAFLLLLSYLSVSFPVSRETEVFVRVVAYLMLHWTLVVGGYRLSEHQSRWFLPVWHTLSAATVVAAIICYGVGVTGDPMWLVVWPSTLLHLLVAYWMLSRACRTRSLKLGALALTGTLWIATIIQSLLIVLDCFSWDTIRLSNSGGVPFGVVLLYMFAGQFILDREEAAVAQRDAIAAERNRILQEMHDGMGAHLITALHLARRDDVERVTLVRSIEESIQDMRSIIDSLDLGDRDIVPLLANLRSRLEPRLSALGIRLVWGVIAPLPEIAHLTPQSALAVMRIIQECVNNAIQHAQARTLRIGARADGDGVRIEIADDGRGFDSSAVREGARGIAGMRARARALHARVSILSSPQGMPGTTVIVYVPCSIAAS